MTSNLIPIRRCSDVTQAARIVSLIRLFILTVLAAGLAGQFFIASRAFAQEAYYRLQLKQGGQYLDADHCGKTITLNPGSEFEGGACQLWRLVPAGGGWSRLQLKQGGQYLDAAYCGKTITLNPGSDFEGGACQLWRFVPAGGGYFRIQLKNGGQYLDAAYCGKTITLNPGSDFEGGACQLWRRVPARGGRIDADGQPKPPAGPIGQVPAPAPKKPAPPPVKQAIRNVIEPPGEGNGRLTFKFTTALPVVATVEIGRRAPDYDKGFLPGDFITRASSAGGTAHTVHLSGLKVTADYHYRIIAGDTRVVGTCSTHPPYTF
jgi:hypothetical protein